MIESNQKPKVTVVIQSYNQEKFIEQCLEGVISQDYFPNIDILVIDDCSTDQTTNLCKQYQRRFPGQMRIVELQNNEFSQGIFVGLKQHQEIKSKYVSWCDGDDYWIDPSKISNQVNFLESNPDFRLVHTDYFVRQDGFSEREIFKRNRNQIEKARKSTSIRELVSGNEIKHSTVLILTEAIDFSFAARPLNVVARDWLIYVSATWDSKIHFLEDRTTVVRVTGAGIWNRESPKVHRDQKSLVRWYCASSLPDSEIRELFRRKVFADWVRDYVASSMLYRSVRPFVLLIRKLRKSIKFLEN